MAQHGSISTPGHRITVIDALRGFALLGVILTHMFQHYSIFSFSDTPVEPLFPKLDIAIRWLIENAIMGRFINVFAFLFGLSFFIQMDRSTKKGIDFRKRFIWRMIILFAIGIIGNCFYSGDILSIYAVFGIIMVFLYRVKNWILIVIVSLLLIGLPRIITTGYNQTVKVEQTINSAPMQNGESRPSAPSQVQTIEKPSFLNSAKNNLTVGMQWKLNYQFGMFGRGYVTLALFILGLIIGRLRFFEQIYTQKKRTVILFIAFVLGVITINWIVNLLPPQTGNIMFIRPGEEVPPALFAIQALQDISRVLFSGALVMGFIILYQIKGIGKCLEIMTPYGRMGLTNYEMQSIIGCLIFSMWAFGSVFGNWGPTEVFALGIVIYTLQIIFSRYWLKYYLYGPLEWLWRSATYLKFQPFRRKLN